MDIDVGTKVIMKKKHPCGCDRWRVTRIGADFKLVCLGCGHEIMTSRRNAERSIKSIEREGETL